MTTKNNTQSKGWSYRVACLALGLVVGAGVAMGVSAACGVFSSDETNVEAENPSSGFAVGDTESHGISLSTVAVQGSGTFNSKTYESSATISATVTPSDATDLTLTWSLAWASTSSATISDYVALSSTTSSSGDSITVYCYQPFSTQIILTAKADAGLTSDVTATATLDYYKAFDTFNVMYDTTNYLSFYSGIEPEYGNAEYNLLTSSFSFAASSGYGVGLSSTSSVGTRDEKCLDYTLTFSLNSDALSLLQGYSSALYSLYIKSGSTYSFQVNKTAASSSASFSMDDIIEGVFGMTSGAASSTYRSQIYTAFLAIYNDYCSAFEVTVTAVGVSSGKTSTIEFSCLFDASGFYTEATGVTLGDTNLYF